MILFFARQPTVLSYPIMLSQFSSIKVVRLFGISLCFSVSCLMAGVLQLDDFEYSKGSIEGLDGGQGWDGAWESVGMGNAISNTFDLSGKLPSGYLWPVERNVLQISPIEKSQRVSRRFTPALDLNPDSPRVYYFSFVFCRVDTSNQQGNETFAFAFSNASERILSFENTSTEQLQITYLPLKKIETGKEEVIKFTDAAVSSPRYIFVGRIEANPAGQEDRFDFSVFDASSSLEAEPQTWSLTLRAEAAESMDTIDFLAAPFLRNILIDNLRIGTDFQSVVRP